MIYKQNDVNTIFKYKDIIGKAFFVIGILMLFYMIISPLTNVFFEPDEFFTFGLIKFPFLDILTATSLDTLPPGYYFILKIFITLLDVSHIKYNPIFVTKMVSLLPYPLILLVSFTKLKKEYNWFTAGAFVFALGLMSGFFFQFLTIRMYNWGLFFLLMSFIYFKDIINNSDIKSWVLFSLFSALVLYTHYFLAFSLALIFLSLFVYLFWFCQDNLKEELKKFMGSIILIILLYSPWIPYFIKQILQKRGKHVLPPLDLNSIFNMCLYYLTVNDFFMIKILGIIFTVFIIIIAFKKYNFEPTAENFYVVSGFFIFFGTIVLTILFAIVNEPFTFSRYFVPVASIIWLSISILIDKINRTDLFIISLIFLLIFGFSGFVGIQYEGDIKLDDGIYWQNLLDEMNDDPNAIVIYDGGVGVLEYDIFLDNLKSYSPPTPTIYGVDNSTTHKLWNYEEKSPDELKKILDYNNDTNIYYINAWGNLGYDNTNLNEIGHMASAKFYHVER